MRRDPSSIVVAGSFSRVVEIDLEEYCFWYLFAGANPAGLAVADVPAVENTDALPDAGFDGAGRIITDLIGGAPRSALLRLQGWSDLVFGSGFESGDTCVWSRAAP